MKSRIAGTLVLLTLALGCSSSKLPGGMEEPEIQVAQVGDYTFSLRYRGPITVGLRLAVANPSEEPILLKQVSFANIGEGAYFVRTEPHYINQEIPPGKTLITDLSIPAFSVGGPTSSRYPVTLRGMAYFESDLGNFQRSFIGNFRQDLGMQ
ncbi:MAG TPA: hypothetical protein VM557_04680 [Thermoanaerobaculia bacterium]|nr:hypothetical protein [Thermoanaerobaculia bacterium]